MYSGHGGKPCPRGGYSQGNIEGDDEEAWEDVEEDGRPPHLILLQDRSCLTLVHTNGVHFCDIQYCSCDGSEESHLQLMMAELFPTTMKSPRTTFTFQVLDGFI